MESYVWPFVFALLGAAIIGLVRAVYRQGKDLDAHKLHVAEQYVSQRGFTKLEVAVTKIQDQLSQVLIKIGVRPSD